MLLRRRHRLPYLGLLPTVLLVSAAGMPACGDHGPSGTGGGPGGEIVEPAGTSMFVEILDATGDARLPTVAITAGGEPLPTNGAGQILLENLAPGRFVARIEAPGYAPANIVGELADGIHGGVNARLLPLGTPIPFDTSVDTDVVAGGGTVRLHIPAGSLITAEGVPATGMAEATFVVIDPSTPDLGHAPAPLEAIAADGSEASLDSYTIAEISVWQGPNRLLIRPGVYAELEMVVPDALAGQVAPGKPMSGWALDLDQGLWKEDATGAVQASTIQPGKLAWIGYLPHLTWWTDAEPWEDKNCFNVTFVDAANQPYVGQKITPIPTSFSGAPATPYSNSAGTACVNIKLNNSALLAAGSDVSSPLATQSVTGVGPPSACGGMGANCAPVTLQTTAARVCTPGAKQACPYTGPAGTENVGLCQAATQYCNADGTAWLPCMGEVLPVAETCQTVFDDDCNGVANDAGPDCSCRAGERKADGCFLGDMSTLNVGVCHAGTATCRADGSGYDCLDEVHSTAEQCDTAADENCDGSTYCAFWGHRFGGTPLTESGDMAVDGSGNVLITGSSLDGSTIDFGQGALTSSGGNGMYVAKLDPDGKTMWSSQFNGSTNARGIAADLSTDEIVLVGDFSGTLSFGGGVSPLTSGSAAALYVTKLGTSGAAVWAHAFTGTGSVTGYRAAVTSTGAILVSGWYDTSWDLGSGVPLLVSAGATDNFVAKLDAGGNPLWARSFGSVSSDAYPEIALDGNGNVLVTGYMENLVDFGNGLPALTSMGSLDIFVAKLDGTSGDALWAKRFGDAATQWPYAIAADAAGNIVIAGWFEGTVDFGDGTGTLTSAGGADIFVAKLAADGTALWSKRYGDMTNQRAYAVALDGMGNIVLTGLFSGTVIFDDGIPWTSVGAHSSFVLKLDPGGDTLWSRAYTESGLNLPTEGAIAVDASNNLLVFGVFDNVIDFGKGPLAATGGTENLFVAKLAP